MFFRLASALLLVLGSSTCHGRQLQMPDINSVQFNYGGININADLAKTNCPDEYTATVTCVMTECPDFTEVCPTVEIPQENVGTAAPVASIRASTSNMTTADNTTNTTNATAAGDSVPVEVPTCDEMEQEFCGMFGGNQLDGCCLTYCTEKIQALASCMILTTTGEDRSNCQVPSCALEAANSPANNDTNSQAAVLVSANDRAPTSSAARWSLGLGTMAMVVFTV